MFLRTPAYHETVPNLNQSEIISHIFTLLSKGTWALDLKVKDFQATIIHRHKFPWLSKNHHYNFRKKLDESPKKTIITDSFKNSNDWFYG